MSEHFDFVVVGSGFGGSVSALRLSEKGYRVLVLEKGRRFEPGQFPQNNRNLRDWFWMPRLGLKGFFQMSFFEHVTVLHGVGVGGGSLTYANTLPTPKSVFFAEPSWAHLADWKRELAPHYATVRRMLGATPNPRESAADRHLRQVARELGREEHFSPTEVGVYFGEPGKPVSDPYFDGRGPDKVGCTHCGACMTGCNVGAKNTLDRNYLYLAEGLGCQILPETEVTHVRPIQDGYEVHTRNSLGAKRSRVFRAHQVIFAGGVLGTLPLLLQLKQRSDGLPGLSDRLGTMVRTNSEALFGVPAPGTEEDFSQGVAITSILHTDERSHVEPVRYGPGSDFFRSMVLPHAPGRALRTRLWRWAGQWLRDGRQWMRSYRIPQREFSQKFPILLYMRTAEGTLTMKLGRSLFTGLRKGLRTALDPGSEPPQAFMQEATDVAQRFAEKIGGRPMSLLTETLLGSPSTAHILGGACMGSSAADGVIDHRHRVFGYPGLYVIDGSAVSANPGVNPSLTISALAERAMGFIPDKPATVSSNGDGHPGDLA